MITIETGTASTRDDGILTRTADNEIGTTVGDALALLVRANGAALFVQSGYADGPSHACRISIEQARYWLRACGIKADMPLASQLVHFRGEPLLFLGTPSREVRS